MGKKILLLTGYDHFFGQTRKPWVSIDTNALIDCLKTYDYDVVEHSFIQLANSNCKISNTIVIYSFSQRDNLRQYIKDIIQILHQKGNLVIPRYELLLCHENKGYQEIIKRNIDITNLPARYFSSKREIVTNDLDYPVVLKTIEGSNGTGVFLIHTKAQLLRKIKILEPQLSPITKIDFFRRRYFRLPKHYQGYDDFNKNADASQYIDYITPEIGFVIQKYIPDLLFDYRIIVLGNHYYVTKRLTCKGDFRASGTKRFTFDFVASKSLLNFAKDVYERLDSPCLSLDIGESNDNFYLFEFQAAHFGINAIMRGKGYYQQTQSGWDFVTDKTIFEEELAYAYNHYLKSMNH